MQVPLVPQAERQAVSMSLPQVPDNEALEAFMAIIDSPLQVGRLPLPGAMPVATARPLPKANFVNTLFNR
ncbi:hypothetical protein PPS11_32410 [Pseudomonas putida S11]|nr:hypothetical protein PPS11_32410 [Pseudomonas putida S11]